MITYMPETVQQARTNITEQMFNELLAELNATKSLYNDEYARRCAVEEENERLREENVLLKEQKHHALTENNQENCPACKLHYEANERQKQIDQARRKILKLDHMKMGSSDKLVALDYLEQVAAKHWDIAEFNQPFNPIMEQVAARCGLSESQLTRINKKQKQAGAWNYEVKREFVERRGRKEIYNCTVTANLEKILSDPESLEKPEGPMGSHQGGARVRLCKDCQSDDLDRYALEYCRSCAKAHLQLLPGLRRDAKALDALDAIKQDRVSIQDIVFEYGDEQKHDALANCPEQKHDALANCPEQKHDALANCPEQKHHAFANCELQDANKSMMQDKVTSRESLHLATVTCTAQIALNKDGHPAQAMHQGHSQRIESYQVCGSTQWMRQDGEVVCAHCWTPRS